MNLEPLLLTNDWDPLLFYSEECPQKNKFWIFGSIFKVGSLEGYQLANRFVV